MIDKETKREIVATVWAAFQELKKEILISYEEEILTEAELCKRIQILTPSVMRACRDFLPQAKLKYRDHHGEHESHVGFKLHATLQMIDNNDLDFTRQDRVVYKVSKTRKKTKKSTIK